MSKFTVVGLVVLMVAVAAGCAGDGTTTYRTGGDSGLSARIKSCRAGDAAVDSSKQCLQDDAACYQLSNGSWCTGERGNTCPAGSVKIATGSKCPDGTRCFDSGESLRCSISFK